MKSASVICMLFLVSCHMAHSQKATVQKTMEELRGQVSCAAPISNDVCHQATDWIAVMLLSDSIASSTRWVITDVKAIETKKFSGDKNYSDRVKVFCKAQIQNCIKETNVHWRVMTANDDILYVLDGNRVPTITEVYVPVEFFKTETAPFDFKQMQTTLMLAEAFVCGFNASSIEGR